MYIGEEKFDEFRSFCTQFGLDLVKLTDMENENEFKHIKDDIWIEVQFLNDDEIHFFVDSVSPKEHSKNELNFYVKLDNQRRIGYYYIENQQKNSQNIEEIKIDFLSYFDTN